MSDLDRRAAIQTRFLRDGLPKRLGNLAANLARIGSFSDHPGHQKAIGNLLIESKLFIEWCVPLSPVDLLAELAELQLLLARWDRRLAEILADPAKCQGMASSAGDWSRRLLERSGLLN